MKKIFAMILATTLCLSLCIPTFAEDINVEKMEVEQKTGDSIGQLEIEQYYDPVSGMRVVSPFPLDIPFDGEYHTLTEVELEYGDTISFNGTWTPSYARLIVEVISTDGSYGTMTTIRSPGSGSFNIREDGTYIIHVKAVSTSLVGFMNFTL